MKVVFFGDRASFISSILFDKLINLSKKLRFDIVLAVDTNPKAIVDSRLSFYFKSFVKKIFNPADGISFRYFSSFIDIANKNKVPIVVPDSINSDDMVQKIRNLNPDVGLSFGNPQIIKKELLNSFKKGIINYHNSLLPSYRGLNATAWSMFHGEIFTGFSFHYVNENIDDGDILLQHSFIIDYSLSPLQVEIIKTFYASEHLEHLFFLLYKGFKGTKQEGEMSYFGKRELESILHYELNDLFDRDRIQHIIRVIKYFSGVWIYVNSGSGDKIYVTKLTENGKIKRIKYLPCFLFYFLRKLRTIL